LTLSWCWSTTPNKTTNTTQTHKTTTVDKAKTTVKQLESKYKVSFTKSKSWNSLPNYEKVKKDYQKELGKNYSYFSVWLFKKANNLFKNNTFFNIMSKWRVKYKVYFDKNGNITKYKLLTYTKKPVKEIKKILSSDKDAKLYQAYQQLAKWVPFSKLSLDKNTLNRLKNEIQLVLKHVKDKKWQKWQLESYLNSKIFTYKHILEQKLYNVTEKTYTPKDKSFFNFLKNIK